MRRKISVKICAWLAAVLLVITTVGDLLVYSYVKDLLVRENTRQYAAAQADGAAVLSLQVHNIQTLMQSVCMDQEVLAYCRSPQSRQEFGMISRVSQRLRSYAGLRTALQSITLVCDKEALWSAYPFETHMTRALEEAWYQAFRPEEATIQFSALHRLNSSNAKQVEVFTCKMNIYDPVDSFRKLGEVLFHFQVDEWQRELAAMLDEFREFAVANQSGQSLLLYHDENKGGQISEYLKRLSPEQWLCSSEAEPAADGFFSRSSVEPGGLVLITYFSRQDISAGSGVLLYFFAVFIFLTVVIIGICCAILVQSMMAQLNVLREGMEHFVEGNLDTRVSIRTGDELEQLGEQFNHMADDINDLIRRQAEEEQQKKKLQFDMLMSRIHPHFLYNTLNSSVFLARRAGAEDCSQMLQALILMLQDGMGIYDGKLYDTLEHELKVVQAYCTIQSYRYKDRFQFLTEIEPGAEGLLIPKNILQPLVENAIYHGVIPAEEPGSIELSVRDTGDAVEIFLSDTGVGMEEQTLQRLNSRKRQEATGGAHSIGIQTIRDRMDYLFGSGYAMEVYSEVGKGTTWFLQFPKISEGGIR